ncbi:hypothetical protein [Nostoc sp.]|uniref:hypothetical protein n=1 Tax=Nostoc sp. TaxID=1180 RepID=UPI002FF5B8DE
MLSLSSDLDDKRTYQMCFLGESPSKVFSLKQAKFIDNTVKKLLIIVFFVMPAASYANGECFLYTGSMFETQDNNWFI